MTPVESKVQEEKLSLLSDKSLTADDVRRRLEILELIRMTELT